MSRANGIEGIERLEGRGITAKVTDAGKQYTTYQDFAESVGYPNAVYEIGYDKSEELSARINEEFDVLAKGKHRSIKISIYVIESNDGKQFLIEESGLEIFGEESESTSLETRNNIEELIAEMRRRAYAEGYEQGFKQADIDAEMEEQFRKVGEWADNVNPPSMGDLLALGREVLAETPQQKRDRIVGQAKADIEVLKPSDSIYEGKYYSVPGDIINYVCYAEYIVNKEKRTVVALMRGYNSGEIYAKGIAKCAPDDYFNVHIGKAIALRRALGLEVPDEYIYAPQPTEVRVGDVVEFDWNGKRETVSEFYPEYDGESGKAFHTKESAGWVGTKQVKIIDDSESIAP